MTSINTDWQGNHRDIRGSWDEADNKVAALFSYRPSSLTPPAQAEGGSVVTFPLWPSFTLWYAHVLSWKNGFNKVEQIKSTVNDMAGTVNTMPEAMVAPVWCMLLEAHVGHKTLPGCSLTASHLGCGLKSCTVKWIKPAASIHAFCHGYSIPLSWQYIFWLLWIKELEVTHRYEGSWTCKEYFSSVYFEIISAVVGQQWLCSNWICAPYLIPI